MCEHSLKVEGTRPSTGSLTRKILAIRHLVDDIGNLGNNLGPIEGSWTSESCRKDSGLISVFDCLIKDVWALRWFFIDLDGVVSILARYLVNLLPFLSYTVYSLDCWSSVFFIELLKVGGFELFWFQAISVILSGSTLLKAVVNWLAISISFRSEGDLSYLLDDRIFLETVDVFESKSKLLSLC